MKIAPAICMLLSLTLVSTVEAAAYRWVDDNGVVVYSQTPPPDGRRSEVKALSSPSGKPAQDAPAKTMEIRQHLEDTHEDRELAKEKAADEKKVADIMQNNCETAKRNLTRLESLGRRLLKTADGKYKRLNEEERQSMMQESREQIKTYCK